MVRRLVILSLGLAACSAPDEGGDLPPASGGSVSASGGAAGSVSTGGTTSTGGVTSTGGSVSASGAAGAQSGGATSTGGSPGGGMAGGAGTGGSPGGAGSGGTAGAPQGGTAGGAHEFQIEFDFRFDETGWFTVPERRQALTDAALAWSSRIRDDFAEIPAGTEIRIRNLDQVDDTYMDFPIEAPIDDLLIFVACSDVLIEEGVGARTRRAALFPGDMGLEFQQMLSDRWQGEDQEPWAVGIAYACVDDYFFDPTPETSDDIPAESTDFLTLTMHEIGHALGISGSQTFLGLTNEEETEFLGESAMTVFGAAVPLDPTGHFSPEILVDGIKPLMTPTFVANQRTWPGRLEFAILEDIGYEIAPE